MANAAHASNTEAASNRDVRGVRGRMCDVLLSKARILSRGAWLAAWNLIMPSDGISGMSRIHILGASGSGSTTLGAAVARRLGVPHVDADPMFWMPADPPFTERRPRGERLALLTRQLPADGRWVFSGSAISWATALEPIYDLIVFLHLDQTERMARLRRRESERYGPRIILGGDMAAASAAFFAWAEAYDTAGPAQRSLAAHEAWLSGQTASVLRLDSAMPVEALIESVLARL
jgi:adenylate kinase family enzyme